MLMVFLLVLTSLTLAVDDTLADTSSDCGFFCKIVNWWTERMGGEAVAGEGGGGKGLGFYF